jgi:hypothetical protein
MTILKIMKIKVLIQDVTIIVTAIIITKPGNSLDIRKKNVLLIIIQFSSFVIYISSQQPQCQLQTQSIIDHIKDKLHIKTRDKLLQALEKENILILEN